LWLAGILLVALVATGLWLAVSRTGLGWRAVATVDGARITRADLDQHIEWLLNQGRVRPEVLADPKRKAEVERSALQDLIDRQVIVAEARRLGITVEPGEEDMAFGKAHGAQWGESKLIESAKRTGKDVKRLRQEVRRQLLTTRLAEKVTSDVAVGDDDVEWYYQANQQTFFIPAAVHLRLLIVDSREEAERLRRQALAGADFPALARAHSTGGAKERGGDMGWVDPRMLPEALAAAVEAIPRTGITPVVEAGKRYYLVRVEGRRAPRQLALAEVQDQIRQMLTAQRKQARFAEWLQQRRHSARIDILL
jgi:peptidyl-prolyl cis-trans isomerase C